jgi:hypothetical protein
MFLAEKFSPVLWMSLSVPVLTIGWVFAAVGVYYLLGLYLGFDTGEENASLSAVWAFLFSFGAVSISIFLASRGKFYEKAFLKKLYAYSIGGSAALFFGYMVIGLLEGLLL